MPCRENTPARNVAHTSPDRAAIVFGGYGTFGQHAAVELAARGLRVTVAGRRLSRAQKMAQQLGESHRAIETDVSDEESCLKAIAGHCVAVNCTGPFSASSRALLSACLQADCHYIDIADDRGYCRMVKSRDDEFRDRNLTVAFGCSSLPGISLAAASVASENFPSPQAARVTLFIGNDNPKGRAAVRSASGVLACPIEAPQGTLLGFRQAERVSLPPPFGRRHVLNFQSPDYDLLPAALGVNEIRVKVGFELRLTNGVFHAFSLFAPTLGRWLLPKLAAAAVALRFMGCSGGAVMVDLFRGEDFHSLAVVAPENGQRMAALPCVYVAQRLAQADDCPRGAVTACDVLGAHSLLELLQADGCQVMQRQGNQANWPPTKP